MYFNILFVLTVFTQIKALFWLKYFANTQNSKNAAAYGPVVSFSDHFGWNREFDQLDFGRSTNEIFTESQ